MRLPYWQKLLYSAGSLGVALSYQAFGTYIQFLYIDIFGVRAALVGAGWVLYSIWNAVNDPLAGYWSDNTRTRWGRRRPWIAAGFIPVGLAFYLLWAPPQPLLAGGQVPLFVYFMAAVLIFDLLWTIVVMNWTSLFPEIAQTGGDRATVSGWRQFFSVFGLLLGVALTPILVGQDWAGRGAMAWLAVITSASLGLSLLGMRERPGTQAPAQPPLRQALAATFQNVPFRWFLGANLFKEFIYSMLTASVPFWAKYVLGIRAPATVAGVTLAPELQNSLLLGLPFIMALPGLPLWTWLAKRLGPARGWQVAQAAFGASMLLLFFANGFVTGAAGTALVGLSLAGLLVFPDLLVADITDEDETVTGARREGMYFGVNGFIIRFAFAMQGITLGAVLTLSGYVEPPDAATFVQQVPSAVLGIRAMTSLVPMAASLVIIYFLGRYPLQGERLARLRQNMALAKAA